MFVNTFFLKTIFVFLYRIKGDDDDNDDPPKPNEEEVRKLYERQFDDAVSRLNKLNRTKSIVPTPPSKPRTKRSAAESSLSFEWLRNDKIVITFGFNNNKLVNLEGFTLFANGTLKFQASNLTTGEYRCKAKFTEKQGRSFVIGPLISKATVVEVAGEFMQDWINFKKLYKV